MSETYQSKRERWQRLLESLPAGLREHVSLRNAESVAALTPRAKARLVDAIRSGLKRLPGAVEQLRVNPDTSVADLLNQPARIIVNQSSEFPGQVQNGLTNLIQQCFPDMPRIAADALANSEVMDIARTVGQAHDQLFNSNHLRTDFVVMILYGLIRQTLEHLEKMIEYTPALQQAFNQSGLPWKPNNWRKQDA